MQQLHEFEAKKAEAEIRKSAAAFMQKSAVAEAAASKKLLQLEMRLLETTNQLSTSMKETEDLKLDHQHEIGTYQERISKLEEETKELRRVLHKISVHNNRPDYEGARTESTDQWTSRDDQIVGKDDAKGAFHAWLHATSLENNTSSATPDGKKNEPPSSSSSSPSSSVVTVPVGLHQRSSSGLLESARRLLSEKLVASSSGHVSVEDETIARALHHTNETLRDALEENMKLQMRIKELELQLKIKELESKVSKK